MVWPFIPITIHCSLNFNVIYCPCIYYVVLHRKSNTNTIKTPQEEKGTRYQLK